MGAVAMTHSRVGIRPAGRGSYLTPAEAKAQRERIDAARRFQRWSEETGFAPSRPVLAGTELLAFRELCRIVGMSGKEVQSHFLRVRYGMSPESISGRMRVTQWQVRVWLSTGADALDARTEDLRGILLVAAQRIWTAIQNQPVPEYVHAIIPAGVDAGQAALRLVIAIADRLHKQPQHEVVCLADAWLAWILGEQA